MGCRDLEGRQTLSSLPEALGHLELPFSTFPGLHPWLHPKPSFIPSRSRIFQEGRGAASFNRFQGIPKMSSPLTRAASCPTLVCYPSWNSAVLRGLEGTGVMEVCLYDAPRSQGHPCQEQRDPHLRMSTMRTAAGAGLGKQVQTRQGAEA